MNMEDTLHRKVLVGKNTIEFFSSVEGVAESFPIQSAKDVIPSWVSKARQDYIELQETQQRGFLHITKCPGIFHLFTTGYILPMWFDLEFRENGWAVADETMNDFLGMLIESHSADGIAKHIPKRPWSWPDIVKINTPWHCIAPKGVRFLVIPIPYTDFFDFEGCSGIYDPSYTTEINVQGYLNNPEGTIMKAGTPLVQIIPLTEKNYDMVVRDKNSKDEIWLKKRKYLNSFSFDYPRHLIKKIYNRMTSE